MSNPVVSNVGDESVKKTMFQGDVTAAPVYVPEDPNDPKPGIKKRRTASYVSDITKLVKEIDRVSELRMELEKPRKHPGKTRAVVYKQTGIFPVKFQELYRSDLIDEKTVDGDIEVNTGKYEAWNNLIGKLEEKVAEKKEARRLREEAKAEEERKARDTRQAECSAKAGREGGSKSKA
ncbi:hypothetical protein BDV96DRAFT_650224 [Lophiotrema nucula]|uniref:Uncharacterized protein n=1 Tax=Lophiotrema nucula TaxID=690887 RepID=A0A6A5YX11_9PLEO|nr:hypothetical protein BDV96DRAFT_650224 [Lophiotrema nucula]